MKTSIHVNVLLLCLPIVLASCSVATTGARPGPAPSPSGVAQTLGGSAEQERSAGRLDNAALLYERALRIEPYNASLWHGLARVRYAQESWRQALALAAKSNTLAGRDRALQADNWKLIGDAHRELGEAPAAQAAYDRAAALQPGGWRRFLP